MSSLFCYIFNFLKIFAKDLPRAKETLVSAKPYGYTNILKGKWLGYTEAQVLLLLKISL